MQKWLVIGLLSIGLTVTGCVAKSTVSPASTSMGVVKPGPSAVPEPPTPLTATPAAEMDWTTSASFADAAHGWLTLNDGTLLATTDGGQSWQKVYRSENNFGHLQFASAEIGWTLSPNGLLATKDGGRTWRPTSTENSTPLDRIGLVTGQPAWASGRGRLYTSVDGGMSWTPVPTPCREAAVGGFSFITQQMGWIICTGDIKGMGWMDKQLYRTADAGRQWDLIAVGGKDEQEANLPGGYLGDLFFLDERHGWYSEIRTGGLYATADGGRSWRRNSDLGGQGVIAIHFSSLKAGSVINVDFATKLSSGLNLDAHPFRLLTTADGGATWVERYGTGSIPRRVEMEPGKTSSGGAK